MSIKNKQDEKTDGTESTPETEPLCKIPRLDLSSAFSSEHGLHDGLHDGMHNRELPSNSINPDPTMADSAIDRKLPIHMLKLDPMVNTCIEKDPLSLEPDENVPPASRHKKRGTCMKKMKSFERYENRPSASVQEFLEHAAFVRSMSFPSSPDPVDPLATTRDASVQTPPEIETELEPRKTSKIVLEKLKELESIDVGNEVDVSTVIGKGGTIGKHPKGKRFVKGLDFEKALVSIYNAYKAGEDNALSSLSDPSTIPEPSDVGEADHEFSTHDTVNVIRSTAQFCEFNNTKIQLLEELVQKDEKDLLELEETLVKNLSAVMCITGVEFIRKCFDRVLKEAINRGKTKDLAASVPEYKFYKLRNKSAEVIAESHPLVQYSKETKQMCKALLAYSGRAFQLFSTIADLPPPFLIRNWSTYPNGDPGFSDKGFKMLQQSHNRANRLTLCSLSVVDVPLQKDVSWDGQRLFGYEDLGFGMMDNDCVREASKAVVFYVKSLTENRQLPVGYCLADNLTPSVRANLIMQYIAHLESVGQRCVALVCDYSVVTHETFTELGAFLDDSDAGWFSHPKSKGTRVMCFTDVFQNLEALSNLWAEKKIFRPGPKAEMAIDVDHIAEGDAFLKSPSVYPSMPAMATLLSDLKQLKSRVPTDLPTINKYNAVMLTVLRDLGVKKFAFTSNTIKFLENLTAVTDMFSSYHPYDCTDRRPINNMTYSEIPKRERDQPYTPFLNRLTTLTAYFRFLCFGNGDKILLSNRKLPVAMIKLNICSLRNIIRRIFYGEKRKLYFHTKRLSLEDVNSCVETICGGAKRIVTASEFRMRFKNYMDSCSWNPSDRLCCDHNDKYVEPDVSVGFNNIFLYKYSPLESVSESAMEFLTENVIEAWLEKVKCAECSQLIQKGILTFRDYNLEGNVVRDIHKMVRTAERCLAQYPEIPCDSDNWFNRLANHTLNSLTSVSGFQTCNHLFVSAGFGEVSHFTVLIKDMLRIFFKLRLCFLTREERIKIQAPREHSMKFNLGRAWT